MPSLSTSCGLLMFPISDIYGKAVSRLDAELLKEALMAVSDNIHEVTRLPFHESHYPHHHDTFPSI